MQEAHSNAKIVGINGRIPTEEYDYCERTTDYSGS